MRIWIAVCAVAGAVALGYVLNRSPESAPEGGPRSVLIITIDTLRADFVGPEHETPALNAFLDTATRFVGTRTVTPLTRPAHASLFSGLSPGRHGIHDNAVVLGDERGFPLLAEEYSKAGYATGAFVSASVLGAEAGLGSGFETYAVTPRVGGASYAPARSTLAAARQWLKGRDEGRTWFAWVHFFDPHAPYTVYRGDALRSGSRGAASKRELYAGEIRRVDAAVEALLADVPDDVIVVIASDHGEGLGEHGEPTHGPLCYSTTIDAFLAVRAPGLDAGARDAAARSLTDIAPSLRTWCGLPEQATDGVRLDEASARVVVSESLQVWRIHGWGQTFAATDGRYTLVESGPRVELFDRRIDPGEREPLELAAHPAYERLDRALHGYRSLGVQGGGTDFVVHSLSPYGVGRRMLSKYLPRPENARLPDPLKKLDVWAALERLHRQVVGAFAAHRNDAVQLAIAELERLSKREQNNPAPPYMLARAQTMMAYLSNDPTWRRAAARSTLVAIVRGYTSSPVIEQLLEDSIAGGDAVGLREALDIAAGPRLRLDIEALDAVVRAARKLDDPRARAVAASILDRSVGRMAKSQAAERFGKLRQLLGP